MKGVNDFINSELIVVLSILYLRYFTVAAANGAGVSADEGILMLGVLCGDWR